MVYQSFNKIFISQSYPNDLSSECWSSTASMKSYMSKFITCFIHPQLHKDEEGHPKPHKSEFILPFCAFFSCMYNLKEQKTVFFRESGTEHGTGVNRQTAVR